MLEFHVEDMSCGHCVSSIKKAVQDAAPKASIEIDLNSHLVRIEGSSDAAQIAHAIREAGYTPVPAA
jgi:copper chaperone